MPITPEQDRELAVAHGLDPATYTYDEVSNSFKMRALGGITPSTQQPVVPEVADVPSTIVGKRRDFGKIETGLAHAASGIGPTGVGLVAGGKTTAALAPVMGPWAAIPGFVVGVGATMAANKGQDVLLEQVAPSANRFLQESAADEPTAAVVGNIASALPFLRPDLKSFQSIPNLIKSSRAGTTLHPADVGNVLNVGIGAGVGAGMGAWEEMQRPEDERSISRILLNAAGNAVINNPRAGLRRFGLHENIYPKAPLTAADALREARMLSPELEATQLDALQSKQPQTPVDFASVFEAGLQTGLDINKLQESGAGPSAYKKSVVPELTPETPYRKTLEEIKAEEQNAKQLALDEARRRKDIARAERAAKPYRAEQEELTKEKHAQRTERLSTELGALDAAEQYALSKEPARAAELAQHYAQERAKIQTRYEQELKGETVIPFDQSSAETIRLKEEAQRARENRLAIAKAAKEADDYLMGSDEYLKGFHELTPKKQTTETPPPLKPTVAEVIYDEPLTPAKPTNVRETKRYQSESELRADLQTAIRTGKVPTNLVPAMRSFYDELGARRNTTITEDGTLVDTTTGQPIAGEIALRTALQPREAKIRIGKAGPDTAVHEVAHGHLEDMLVRGSRSEKNFARTAYDVTEQTQAYKDWLTADPERQALNARKLKLADDVEVNAGVDEFLSERTGQEFVRRMLQEAGQGTSDAPRSFWSDFKRQMRVRSGKATLDDVSQILYNRVLGDPEFKYTFGARGEAGKLARDGSSVEGERQQFESLGGEADNYDILHDSEFLQLPFKERLDLINADASIQAALVEHLAFDQPIARQLNGIYEEFPVNNLADFKKRIKVLKYALEKSNARQQPASQLNMNLESAPQSTQRAASSPFDEMKRAVREADELAPARTWADLTPEERARQRAEGRSEMQQRERGRRYQDESIFTTDLQLALDTPRPLDLTPNSQGRIKLADLRGRLTNKLTPGELDIYNTAGLQEWLNKQGDWVQMDDFREWVSKNAPRVELVTYGMEGKVSEAKREYDRMTHEWYDTLNAEKKRQASSFSNVGGNWQEKAKRQLRRQGWTDETAIEKAIKWNELASKVINEPRDTSPRATSYYESVSAFDTNEPMPEWTTSKEGRNVQRVDVVIPQTAEQAKVKAPYGYALSDEGLKDAGIIWKPDNLHENLPNTLGWAMIQYKTGPKGEKIAVVTEAQSRWGQEVREGKKTGKEKRKSDPYYKSYAEDKDHPLLSDYNRLILKAAIDQARKEGATHIVVSDAETAMMSEMLDNSSYLDGPYDSKAEAQRKIVEAYDDNWKAFNIPDENGDRWYVSDKLGGFDFNYGGRMAAEHPASQKGNLNSIAKELTGQEGQRVSLGEHKNAYTIKEGGRIIDVGQTEPRLATQQERQRLDLIFKNPDGTPKIDVSGVMYELTPSIPQRAPRLFGKRYQSESGLRMAPDAPIEEQATQVKNRTSSTPGNTARPAYTYKPDALYSTVPGLRSRSEAILRNKSVPKNQARYIADHVNKFEALRSLYEGEFGHRLMATLREFDADVIDSWFEKAYKQQHGITPKFTPEEQNLANKFSKPIKEILRVKNAKGLKTEAGNGIFREAREIEGYVPEVISGEAVWHLTQEPLSVEAKFVAKELENHYFNAYRKEGLDAIKARNQARADVELYTKALGNKVVDATEFAALRRPRDAGLPWSLVEKNPVLAMSRYGKRVARDLAFFETIQDDAVMRYSTNTPDQYGKLPTLEDAMQARPELGEIAPTSGTKEVQQIMDSVRNVKMYDAPRIKSAAQAVSNAIMGIGTGLRDSAAIPLQALPYMPVRDWDVFARALSDLREGQRSAYKRGAIKSSLSDYDYGGAELVTSPDKWVNMFSNAANLFRKYQGRELIEQLNRAYTFNVGEELARRNVARAVQGDKDAVRFIERFGTTLENKSDLLTGKVKPTEDDLQRMAAEFVGVNQGNYDQRGLPSAAIDSPVAPFLALSRWSLEKANTINKDVIQRAVKDGDYAPMLRYMLGGLVTGVIIEKLNEALSGKRAEEATVEEVMKSPEANWEDRVAKVISIAQLSSFGGFFGDAAKLTANAYTGDYSRYSNPISFPLYTWTMETLLGNITDAAEAIREGKDPVDVLGQFSLELAAQTFQNARYARAHYFDEETDRKERFRDIRAFKRLKGDEVVEGTDRPNPYEDMDAKTFKRTSDMDKAAELLPSLLEAAIRKAKNDPYKLKNELRSLKANSYQTFPSPENMPNDAARYYLHLERTQGAQKAAEALTDYLLQREVNKAKSQMVPNLEVD